MKRTLLILLSLAFSLQAVGENLRTEEVEFVSHGVTLSGSIVFPDGDIHAAVVFVHGSGKQERNLHWAERFAREGIAALVYDKRGAGSRVVNTRATRASARRTFPCWRTMRGPRYSAWPHIPR